MCVRDSSGDKDRQLIYLQFSVWKWNWVSVGVNLWAFLRDLLSDVLFGEQCCEKSERARVCERDYLREGLFSPAIVRKEGMLLQVDSF